MNWKYTVSIKDVWSKYSEYDHEYYDENPETFSKMKNEMVSAIKKKLSPNDAHELSPLLKKLSTAKHLSSFNRYWSTLYDYCDMNRIWLATNF